MRVHKLMAILLAVSILVSAVPVTANAQEIANDPGAGSESVVLDNLYLDKTAELKDDGTYTINLEAYATGTTIHKTVTEGVPLDVVLVMDQSGSLVANGSLNTLKSSVNSFLEALRANGEEFGINHRVAICGFASYGKQGASGVAGEGYTYANNIRDNAWTNTGIFVDGTFVDYGTVEYNEVTSVDDIDESKTYAIYGKFMDESEPEMIQVMYSSSSDAWRSTTSELTVAKAGYYIIDSNRYYLTANQALLAKYYVYTVGESSNQLTNDHYAAAWENISSGENGQGSINPDITQAVGHLSSNGGTATFMGMKMARKMLENIPAEADGVQRKKIVIVFTDGEPGVNGYAQGDADAALADAARIKESGTEIYTIGMYSESTAETVDVDTFMNRLSSNYVSHSFETSGSELAGAMFKISASTGYSDNGDMYYHRNIDNSVGGMSPYFYKTENDEYWPIYSYKDNGYKVLYIDDTGEGYMDSLTGYRLVEHVPNSNPKADYYKYASGIGGLSSIFETISSEVTGYTSELSLDANAVLKDVLADGFTLTDNTTITVSVVPGAITGNTITWGTAQTVVNYPAQTSGSVVVNGAADRTRMTLTVAATEDGVITVTGFNYAKAKDANQINAQYISEGHPGSKLVVTITGVEAEADVITDAVISTNRGISGIYEGTGADSDGDGETGELQASFPVPTTKMTSMVYVLDYAKPMTVATSDFLMNQAAITLDTDGYNRFTSNTTAFDQTYGKISMVDGKITYQPVRMNWDGYDTFYVFGKTDSDSITSMSANRNGNMWAKVSMIPANNVYYEDTFVTSEEDGVAGIVYTGKWDEVDASGNENVGGNGQDENPESNETDEGNNQGGVHGWEDTLANDTNYSDGSAHVSSETGATATFTFTGTGVDIYSRTNSKTGIVLALLYKGDSIEKNPVAKYSIMVDNLAASGDYFQVPTLSLFKIPLKDENGKIQKNENGQTIMTDLPHGTYTVKIVVSKASASQTGRERFLYYLDGIRVYNPIKNLEGKDDTVTDAYEKENELNATFVEIRDKLLDANSFTAGEEISEGPVFIDRITSEDGTHEDNTNTLEIGTYETFGPENEVYLAAGQTIAFAVDRQDAHYYIGLKSLTDEAAVAILNGSPISIGHTTDLYYEVFPAWKEDENGNMVGTIVVKADSSNGSIVEDESGNKNYVGAILTLTKLKVTGPELTAFKFARVSNSRLLAMAHRPPVTTPDPEENTPDVPGEDVETPDIGTENGTPVTPNVPSVDIENPGPDTSENEQAAALYQMMIELLTRIFGDLRSWFEH